MNRRSFLKAIGVTAGLSASGAAAQEDSAGPDGVEFETRPVDAEVVTGATPIVVDPEIADKLSMDYSPPDDLPPFKESEN